MRNSLFLLLLGFFFTWTACKKDDNNNNNDSNKMLVIENGAQSVEPGGASLTYTAVLIDQNGQRMAATGVTWTSSESSVATISSSGVVSIAGTGVSTIRASVTVGGSTLTAEAPLNVRVPGIFAVAPSAILVDVDFPDIPLMPVYLGTGNPTYAYQSSNPSVATVSSAGVVNFVGVGSCQITVTANGLDGNPQVVVPVMVIGVPQIELPVVRVQVSPAAHAMLRSESQRFTARAFNGSGQEVNNPSITWSVEDPSIATIDANGNVTPVAIGSTTVRAMVNGIVGEAELEVVADQVLIVEPYYASVGAGNSRQFTARQYPVVRSNGELVLGTPTTPSNLNWTIPTYGIPVFDIATVNSTGLVTVRSNASPGLMTFVMASIPGNDNVQPGVGTISVALADQCNCGTADAAANSLSVSPASITVGFGQTVQINAQVLDALGNPISGANIVYCSDNVQVASVDMNGEVSGMAFGGGTATIRVCHGNLSRNITVTIQ
jgi:uncharacterized protein YjdB